MDLVWGAGVFVQKDGRFELARVPRGSYYMAVMSMTASPRLLVRQAIDVVDDDVDDITIPVGALAQVPGQLVVDEEKKADLGGIRISLIPADAPGVNPPAAVARPDGGFVLEGIGAEPYSISIVGGPPDGYVKSIRIGTREVRGGRIELAEGASIHIVLSMAGGQIEGIAKPQGTYDGGSKEVLPSATVVLAPDPPRPEEGDAYRVTNSDQTGRFFFKGLRPGDYRLYAWEDVEPGAWFDADVLRANEDSSVKVTVMERSAQSVVVPLILAGAKDSALGSKGP
jgi:hypothetical protein